MPYPRDQYLHLVTRASALDSKLNSCDTIGSEGRVLCPGRQAGNGRDYRPQLNAVTEYYSELLNSAQSAEDAIAAVAHGIAQTEWIALSGAGYEPFFNYLRSSGWPLSDTPAADLYEEGEGVFANRDPAIAALMIFRGLNHHISNQIGRPEIGRIGADEHVGSVAPAGFVLQGLPVIFPDASDALISKLEGLLFKAATLTLNRGKPVNLYVGIVNLEQVFGREMTRLRREGALIPPIQEEIDRKYQETLKRIRNNLLQIRSTNQVYQDTINPVDLDFFKEITQNSIKDRSSNLIQDEGSLERRVIEGEVKETAPEEKKDDNGGLIIKVVGAVAILGVIGFTIYKIRD